MKILCKFPSRSRPVEFLKTLLGYISMAEDKSIVYLISIDEDDDLMLSVGVLTEIYLHPNVSIDLGKPKGKINAVNRGMDKFKKEWDILVLISDDMVCQVKGWDTILKNEMQKYFPDTDGVLWHNDGFTGLRLNTMCILGRKYYERFGYIYNPEYSSLWCDNEFMEVANKLNRQQYFDQCLFKHMHFSNTPLVQSDQLMKKNESYYQTDKEVYTRRKAINFGL